jgi:hypothetical protein
MAMGREGDRQGDLIVSWAEMPRSPGHVFYDRLQEVLISSGFDRFVETTCQRYYAPKMGAGAVEEAAVSALAAGGFTLRPTSSSGSAGVPLLTLEEAAAQSAPPSLVWQ